MIPSTLANFSSILQSALFILFGCIGMGFLIGFHELGHFMFAKLFNVRTPSFSIGFGPKIISKKIGETEFSLSAIPLGGYVEIAGAAEIGQGEQKEAHATDVGSFAKKPYYQKLLIMLGGILFNLAFAYCALIILCATGIPKTPLIQKTTITHIVPGSAAEKCGLSLGDRIIAINGVLIENNVQTLQSIIYPLASQQTAITFERNGALQETSMTLGEKFIGGKTVGTLGVEFEIAPTPAMPFTKALTEGISMTNSWIKNTITGFMNIRKNHGEMGGPVMIIAMTTRAAASGFKILLLLLAIISINLAILNLIPLPILDGGQILFYTIEAVIRRPLPDKIREYIHIGTWIMFILLFLYLSAKDIFRLASPHITSIFAFFKA
jgi:regulator of sigma E protease